VNTKSRGVLRFAVPWRTTGGGADWIPPRISTGDARPRAESASETAGGRAGAAAAAAPESSLPCSKGERQLKGATATDRREGTPLAPDRSGAGKGMCGARPAAAAGLERDVGTPGEESRTT
jgi:hypothetical protein